MGAIKLIHKTNQNKFERFPILTFLFSKVTLVGIVLLAVAVTFLTLGRSPDQVSNTANILLPVYNLLASLGLFWAAWRLRNYSRAYSLGWLLLGCAQFSWFLGDGASAIIQNVSGSAPTLPSIADLFYLLCYPLYVAGFLHFPAPKPSRTDLLKIVLQVTIIVISAFLILWNFLIGPSIVQTSTANPLLLWIATAYPIGDLLLLLSVTLLILRRQDNLWMGPMWLIGAGVLATIVADVLFNYAAVQNIHTYGYLYNIAFLASYVLMGSAGWLQVRLFNKDLSGPPHTKKTSRLTFLALFTPYLWVIIAYIFLIFSANGHIPMPFMQVAICVGVVTLLVVVLQSITLMENGWLARRLRQANEGLENRVHERTLQLNNSIKLLETEALARAQAVVELQSSRELYRAVVEDLPVLICRFQQDGMLTFVNDAYSRYYRHAPEALVGTSFYDRIVENDVPFVHEKIDQLNEATAISVMEHQVYGIDQTIHWLRWTCRVVFSQGQLIEYQAIGEDITDKKEAEEGLRSSEEKFRDLFDNSSDLIQIIAPDGHFLFVNRAWREALEYSEESLASITIWDVLSLNCQAACRRHMEEALQGKPQRNLRVELKTKHGKILFVEGAINCTFKDGQPVYIRGIFRDISERLRNEEQLRRQAFTDSLTGLPNRAYFVERLSEAIQECQRETDACFALFYLDLDNFKVVNDSLGHQVGDQLLVTFAGRLRSRFREDDAVSRLGGDEFVVLCRRLSDENVALQLAKRVLDDLRRPVTLESQDYVVTASIGIVFGNSEMDASSVMRDADIALYNAKSLGKDRVSIFRAALGEASQNRMQDANDLRAAVERHEFIAHYQPVFEIPSRRVVGFEALLRWQHPTRGLVMPLDFIHIAEETGLIIPIGAWILDQACSQLALWQRIYPEAAGLGVSVNLSARQFADPGLDDLVEDTLNRYHLKPTHLALEITETALMENMDIASQMLNNLHKIGVHIFIDDFGTGYSSLERLQRLPIDTIKIDRSFLQSPEFGNDHGSILRAIAVIGTELGLDVIAEGVEEEAQLQVLKDLDIHYSQGFFFSCPAPAEEMEIVIRGQQESLASDSCPEN
jgi:diguanylate cyclase (GGDEF)-like protein/PAS domain S-box-containing protein